MLDKSAFVFSVEAFDLRVGKGGLEGAELIEN